VQFQAHNRPPRKWIIPWTTLDGVGAEAGPNPIRSQAAAREVITAAQRDLVGAVTTVSEVASARDNGVVVSHLLNLQSANQPTSMRTLPTAPPSTAA
jgi:hypothetical protein